jgi:glutathionylspermidine synthase
MKRLPSAPRPDFVKKIESVGLTYHLHQQPGGPKPYWNESACYEFTLEEVLRLEQATKDLHYLLIDVAEQVIQRDWWGRLGIPERVAPVIQASWDRDDFSLYGRFDLAMTPGGVPKMLEYNADTPTALVEAAVAQWYWKEEVMAGRDQFNSIHERLIEAWKRFAGLHSGVKAVEFTSVQDNLEDEQTVSYLMDTAQSAGFKTRWSAIEDLGFDARRQSFVTAPHGFFGSSDPLLACFKLYPWEWIFHSQAADQLQASPTLWLEPAWKALLSNKGIMACAWELHPGHPNLLPTFFDQTKAGRDYVQKPLLSREGANVIVYRDTIPVFETLGEYGEEGVVFQALAEIPDFDGNRPVLGSWVVDHEPAGMGIRESDGLVTDNLSRFVPHYIFG